VMLPGASSTAGTMAQVIGGAPASCNALMRSAASSPGRHERGPHPRIEAPFGTILTIERGDPEIQARPPVRLTSGERTEPMRCRSGYVDAGSPDRTASGRSSPGAMAISL
jgi:hypothetical protein